MRQHLTAAVLSVGLGFGIASSAFADAININPQGAGGTISVSALDWLPGNALCTPVAGSCVQTVAGGANGAIQVYGHTRLGTFVDGNGNAIALASPFEWTAVFGFQETATSTGPNSSQFRVTAGGNNFFQIWYQGAADSSNLTGTGFNNGQLILAGTVAPFNPVTGSGSGDFAASATATNPLDQFNGDNYPGILSVSGTGSTDFTALVSFFDPAFFPGGIGGLRIVTDTFQNLPFQQQNPSSCFWNGTAFIGGAGPGNFGGPCANTIGTLNGISGPNDMFQTDATSSFIRAVPEPGSLVLMALGLLSLVGFSRKSLS